MKISVPNPCNESWEAMTENGHGRFCASCEKVIIDFTKMMDEDFIAYFRNYKNNTCGRFTERQLKIEIPDKSISILPLSKMSKYVAASMIAVAGLSGKVFGQENPTVQTPVKLMDKSTTDSVGIEGEIIIRGRVLDYRGDALIGASIKIVGTNDGTMTDFDGNFELKIIPDSRVKFYELQTTYIGYPIKSRVINIYDIPSLITFQFKEDELPRLLGDVIIVRENRWQHFKRWIRDRFL